MIAITRMLFTAIGGAGTSPYMAGVARLAIVFLALASGGQNSINQKIMAQLETLEGRLEAHAIRIMGVERTCNLLYTDPNIAKFLTPVPKDKPHG